MKILGRIDGRFYPDGKSREFLDRDGIAYVRPVGEKMWRILGRVPLSGRKVGSERA